MKIMIATDAKGQPIASFRPTPLDVVSVELEPEKGVKLVERDVPEDYSLEPDASFKAFKAK